VPIGHAIASEDSTCVASPSPAVAIVATALALGCVSLAVSAQSSPAPTMGQGFVGAWHLDTETPFGSSRA
jgi:hypothetical protein